MGAQTGKDADTWDRERIKAELRRNGYSLSSLAREHGYHVGYFSQALVAPIPKAEKIIGDILGVSPAVIWPARYGPDGQPLRGRFTPNRDGHAKRAARQPSEASS